MLALPPFGAMGKPAAEAAVSPAEAGTIITAKLTAASTKATRDIKLLLRHDSQSMEYSVRRELLKHSFVKQLSCRRLVRDQTSPMLDFCARRRIAALQRSRLNSRASLTNAQLILII